MAKNFNNSFIKDPDSSLDYSVDWATWLSSGDTISVSAWTVPAGLTEVSSSINTNEDGVASSLATVVLSGGTVGVTYKVVNSITTANGSLDDRTLEIRVVEK